MNKRETFTVIEANPLAFLALTFAINKIISLFKYMQNWGILLLLVFAIGLANVYSLHLP